MRVPEFLKPLLALFAIGAITQAGDAQARNLRAQIEDDGAIGTSGVSQEIEAPAQGFGVVTEQSLSLAESSLNTTLDLAEAFATVNQEWFIIPSIKEQTQEKLEEIGNSIQSTEEQSELAERRKLVFIGEREICLDYRFIPTNKYKDRLNAKSHVQFQPIEITTNGVRRIVKPETACLAITFPLQDGKYITVTIGKLLDKYAAAGISSFHIDANTEPLKLTGYIELKFYDSYNDPTKGEIKNVVQFNLYSYISHPFYGRILSKSVFLELPGPSMKDAYTNNFLMYPWAPSQDDSLPGVKFTLDGTPVPTIAPETSKPTSKPTTPPTPKPTYEAVKTKNPTSKSETNPPTTDKDETKTNFPTSTPTGAAASNSPTSSSISPTATTSTSTTAGGGTGDDGSTTKIAAGIVLAAVGVVGVATVARNNNKKKLDAESTANPLAKGVTSIETNKKEAPLAKPRTRPSATKQATPVTPMSSKGAVPPVPVTHATQNTSVARPSTENIKPGSVAELRAKFEKGNKP